MQQIYDFNLMSGIILPAVKVADPTFALAQLPNI